jgi:hypothetical protein
MTRSRIVGALIALMIVMVAAFIANNSEWTEIKVPTPAKGEALTNPFYAAQQFSRLVGARARHEVMLALPSTEGVVVLSAWHWDLSPARHAQLEQWVEQGGRLVVDERLTGNLEDFEAWTDVEWDFDDAAADKYDSDAQRKPLPRCAPLADVESREEFSLCDRQFSFSFLKTGGTPQWALRNQRGLQAVRVGVGQGSVTIVNAVPFTQQALFDGDHARLFVAATQLRRGDEVVFLTEHDHPSLLALLWQHASPAVMLALVCIGLLLWRDGVRFGPLVAVPDPGRRSIAEQIRGTGRFVLERGDGVALHAASARALTEAARRRIPAYARLPRKQRAAALGRFTGLDGEAITSAIEDASKRRPNELRNTLALLEMARRQLLVPTTDPQR